MILDSNQGMLSIYGRPGFEEVKSHTVRGWRDLEDTYNNFIGTGRKDWTKRKTIVFDQMDDIQGLILDDLTERAAEKDPRRAVDETQQREWGIMLTRLRRLMRKYKALPQHKVLLFASAEDKITGKLNPALQGRFAKDLPYFADMIGYLRIAKKGKRVLSFQTREEYLGKCRGWWLSDKERRFIIPDAEEEPQFLSSLFELIAAGPKQTTSKTRSKE